MSSTMSPTHEVELRPRLRIEAADDLLGVDAIPAGDRPADRVRLVVVGELDIASAPVLADAVVTAAHRTASIDVDLAGITFIDSQGLHLLLTMEELAGRSSVRITSWSDVVARLFRVVGLQLPA